MKIEDAKNFEQFLSKEPKAALKAFDVAITLYKLKIAETFGNKLSIENLSVVVGLCEDMQILELARNDIAKYAERN